MPRIPPLIISALVCASPALAAISNIQTRADAEHVHYAFEYTQAASLHRVYLDTDEQRGTGLAVGSLGADYLLENGSLYRYTGSGWNWSWARLKPVRSTLGNGLAR